MTTKEKTPTEEIQVIPASVAKSAQALGESMKGADVAAQSASKAKVSLAEVMASDIEGLAESKKVTRKAIRASLIIEMSKTYDNEKSISGAASTVELCAVYVASNGFDTVQAAYLSLAGDGTASTDNLAKLIRAARNTSATTTKGEEQASDKAKESGKLAASNLDGCMAAITNDDTECATTADVKLFQNIIHHKNLDVVVVELFKRMDADERAATVAKLAKVK